MSKKANNNSLGGQRDDPSGDVLAEGVAADRRGDDERVEPDSGGLVAERLPTSAADLDEADEGSARTGGRFFAIDSRVWPGICSLGLNPAVTYLVLACGTGRDMVHTTWSVHAIEKYTSISRIRAREAVKLLIDKKLISGVEGKTSHPRYRLDLAVEPIAPAGTLLPRGPGRETDLHARSIPWIWLPNTLVTGAAGETAPIELVRQTQDVMVLRLLVELYGDQHLRADGGVRRDVVSETYKRHRLGSTGQFEVWGFNEPMRYAYWQGAAACHRRSGPDESAGADFFPRLESLDTTGLIEFVPHLVESESPDSEILHPYGLGDSDGIEDRLGTAASDAAYALLTETSQQWATRLHVAPVPRHVKNVQMVGIARLRYRAQTRAAAAWQRHLHETGSRHLEVYRKIVAARTARERRCNING
jgi:hypothetical protein